MSVLITFEGPEGSGKSTQAKRLAEWLEEGGRNVLSTREPGGTPLGETVRQRLLDPDGTSLTPRAELLLYLAARAQHVEERIRPALRQGIVVICDRFTDASVAYQGYGRQLGADPVRRLNAFATDGLQPDLTFILDLEPEVGLGRARRGSEAEWGTVEGDRLEREALAFHHRVREGYLALAESAPERCVLLDATASIDDTCRTVRGHVEERLDIIGA